MDPTRVLEGEARFDLKRQLADTLQGRIYSATDRNTTDYCVVKETWKQLVRMKRSRDGHRVPEDFENEKAIMSYLSNDQHPHPGFVRILDEWEDEHCYFYAMEGCRGGELFQYIKDQHTKGSLQSWVTSQSRLAQRPMKENNEWTLMVKTMFRQLVDCVKWMHDRGVCHLDLSLENSMIHDRRKKHVKIIDFGLGRYFGNDDLRAINRKYNSDKSDPANAGRNIRPQYTQVKSNNLNFANNQRVGKTGYMAPEVYDRKEYDARAADIWSLGVMLFMMCIGAPPYEYPTEQNAAFRFIIGGKLADVLKHWKRLRLVTEEQLNLMEAIFKPEKERITMEQLISHPFVQLKQKPLFQPTLRQQQAQPYGMDVDEEKRDSQQKQQQQQSTTKSSNSNKTNSNNTTNNTSNKPSAGSNPTNNEADFNSSNEDELAVANRNKINTTFKSEIAKNFKSRIERNENLTKDALIQILNEVESKRNELLSKNNKNNNNNNNPVNVDSGPQTNTTKAGMSNAGEDDPTKSQMAINELETIVNYTRQRIANTN